MLKLFSDIAQSFGARAVQHPQKIDIIKSKNSIRTAMLECAKNGFVIGVYAPALADGMLLLGIDDFSFNSSEPVVLFKKYDMNGIELPRTQVALSEIRSVCPFDCPYESPAVKTPPKHPVLVSF